MEYRKFGPTDITVSALGFGCHDDARQRSWGEEFITQMATTVNHAIEQGITCFDTAPNYGGGDSELMLGRALGSRRKDVVVVTKCGLGFEGSAVGRPKGRDSRKGSILPLVDQSLRRLQTDYLDVLLVHLPDQDTPLEETMSALNTAVQQGKVRSVGVSNFTLEQIKECQVTRPIDVVQYGLSMFDRRMEKEIFPYCHEQGIGVMVYGPLGVGLLTGTFTAETKFDDHRGTGSASRFFGGMFDPELWQRNLQLVEDLKSIAENLGKTMAQLALRWVLSNPAVSVAIPGTLNVKQLEENLGVLNWSLSGDDMRHIDDVFAKYGVDTHPNIPLP